MANRSYARRHLHAYDGDGREVVRVRMSAEKAQALEGLAATWTADGLRVEWCERDYETEPGIGTRVTGK